MPSVAQLAMGGLQLFEAPELPGRVVQAGLRLAGGLAARELEQREVVVLGPEAQEHRATIEVLVGQLEPQRAHVELPRRAEHRGPSAPRGRACEPGSCRLLPAPSRRSRFRGLPYTRRRASIYPGGQVMGIAESGALQGKVAVITGAATGIGRASALLFAAGGRARGAGRRARARAGAHRRRTCARPAARWRRSRPTSPRPEDCAAVGRGRRAGVRPPRRGAQQRRRRHDGRRRDGRDHHAGALGPGAGRQRARDLPGEPGGRAAHAGRRRRHRQHRLGVGVPRVRRAADPRLRGVEGRRARAHARDGGILRTRSDPRERDLPGDDPHPADGGHRAGRRAGRARGARHPARAGRRAGGHRAMRALPGLGRRVVHLRAPTSSPTGARWPRRCDHPIRRHAIGDSALTQSLVTVRAPSAATNIALAA